MIRRNTQGRSKANKIARQLRVLSTFKIKAGDANDPGYVAYVNRKITEEETLRKATGQHN